jgi:hypothetical protein
MNFHPLRHISIQRFIEIRQLSPSSNTFYGGTLAFFRAEPAHSENM